VSRASSRTNLFPVLAAHVTPPLILPPPAVLAAAISEGRYPISISRPAPSIYRAKASINEDYHSVSLCGRCRCLVCRAWRRSSSQSSSQNPRESGSIGTMRFDYFASSGWAPHLVPWDLAGLMVARFIGQISQLINKSCLGLYGWRVSSYRYRVRTTHIFKSLLGTGVFIYTGDVGPLTRRPGSPWPHISATQGHVMYAREYTPLHTHTSTIRFEHLLSL
jgi:hypothetical protein